MNRHRVPNLPGPRIELTRIANRWFEPDEPDCTTAELVWRIVLAVAFAGVVVLCCLAIEGRL